MYGKIAETDKNLMVVSPSKLKTRGGMLWPHKVEHYKSGINDGHLWGINVWII